MTMTAAMSPSSSSDDSEGGGLSSLGSVPAAMLRAMLTAADSRGESPSFDDIRIKRDDDGYRVLAGETESGPLDADTVLAELAR